MTSTRQSPFTEFKVQSYSNINAEIDQITLKGTTNRYNQRPSIDLYEWSLVQRYLVNRKILGSLTENYIYLAVVSSEVIKVSILVRTNKEMGMLKQYYFHKSVKQNSS